MSSSQAFTNSTHITTSVFKPGHAFPANTHLKGIIAGWNHYETATSLKILMKCEIPNDGTAPNDYMFPQNGGSTSCFVHVDLGVSRSGEKSEDVEKAVLLAAGKDIAACCKKNIMLELTGLRVVRYTRGETGMKLELQGWGERNVQLPDGRTKRLFRFDAATSSNTPSWFSSPTPTPARAPGAQKVAIPQVETTSRMRPITSHVPNFNIPKPALVLHSKKRSPSPEKPNEAKRLKPNDSHTAFPPRNGFDGLNRQLRKPVPSETLPVEAVVPPKSPETLRKETEDRVKEKGRIMSEARARAQANIEQHEIEEAHIFEGLMEHDIFTPMTPENDAGLDSGGSRTEDPVFKVKCVPEPKRPVPMVAAPHDTLANAGHGRIDRVKSSPAHRHEQHLFQAPSKAAGSPSAYATPSHLPSPAVYESREARLKRLGLQDNSSPVRSSMQQRATPSHDLSLRVGDFSSPAIGSHTALGKMRQDTPVLVDGDAGSARGHGTSEIAPEMTAVERAQEKSRAAIQARVARQQEEEEQTNTLKGPVHINGIDYITIGMARNGTRASLMGIVVEYPKAASKPRDWTTNVVIADPTTHVDGAQGEGMVIQIFRANENDLPMNLYPGRPILFRNLKFGFFNEKVKGHIYSIKPHDHNGWAYSDKTGKMTTSEGIAVTEEEKERLKQLRAWWAKQNAARPGETGQSGPVAPDFSPASDNKRGSALLQDVAPGNFFVATVKIIHVVRNASSNPRYEVYVTDGTAHARDTHNFHNVNIGIPSSAIFCMAIFDQQPPEVDKVLNDGNYARFPNVRVSENTSNGLLQLRWSEAVTYNQRAEGWKAKKCDVILPSDHRAMEINRRINELKRVEQGLGPQPVKAVQPANVVAGLSGYNGPMPQIIQHAVPLRPPIVESAALATHLSTIYTDKLYYPSSTITEIVQNGMVPNKFRLQARVKAIFPRNPPTGSPPIANYICFFCKKCERPYNDNAKVCHGCKDNSLADAELRYRFIAVLEQGGETLTALITDYHAAEFLPPLPPLSPTDNPNDLKKIETRMKEANEGVEKMLLGAMMDGRRSRPVIDWTVECYLIRNTKKGAKGEVVVYSVFGMKSN